MSIARRASPISRVLVAAQSCLALGAEVAVALVHVNQVALGVAHDAAGFFTVREAEHVAELVRCDDREAPFDVLGTFRARQDAVQRD